MNICVIKALYNSKICDLPSVHCREKKRKNKSFDDKKLSKRPKSDVDKVTIDLDYIP